MDVVSVSNVSVSRCFLYISVSTVQHFGIVSVLDFKKMKVSVSSWSQDRKFNILDSSRSWTLTSRELGMCGMDFSSLVRFRFSFEKNRGFGFGSV